MKENYVYNGQKQGQITPNIELKYVLKLIRRVAQCSKITNTVLLLKQIFHDFSAFEQLSISNVRMSEGTFCRVGVHIQIVKYHITLRQHAHGIYRFFWHVIYR